jgi:hypothetical protein
MDPSAGWDDDQVGSRLVGLECQSSQSGLPGQDLEHGGGLVPDKRPSAIEILASSRTTAFQ